MRNKEVGGMEEKESDLTTSHVSDDNEELTRRTEQKGGVVLEGHPDSRY